MLIPVVDLAPAEALCVPVEEILENITVSAIAPVGPPKRQRGISKQAIRQSLKASTLDGIFSTIFGSVTGGVLLSSFALGLGATNVEIGLLCAIPMVANFLQPVGAYFADRQTSRRQYNLWVFGISRLLWLILAVGIGLVSFNHSDRHQLVQWTLAIVFATSLLSALGSASWLSWMAVLVPHRLRGRYFGLRNSAASLTSLLCVPLMGMAVSAWAGGTVQGYGAVLLLGILAGILGLVCQFFKADVNPQDRGPRDAEAVPPVAPDCNGGTSVPAPSPKETGNIAYLLKNSNFLRFLLYVGLWTFAINLSSPFFNIYMLKDLALDVRWVTIYSSLAAGANLLMLMMWGKLADRLGNRPVLIFVGILVAVTPLFWLLTGNNSVSLWVWLPLLHLLSGGTWAAIDLCNNNIQMEIAPQRQSSSYFAIAAAVAGVAGALGTTAGGFLAEFSNIGGLSGLFALSAVVRLVALLPLIFVREPRSLAIDKLMRTVLPLKPQAE